MIAGSSTIFRLLLTATIASSVLRVSVGQPEIALTSFFGSSPAEQENNACPVFGCCEEDCCGVGTSWDISSAHCILDLESSGFNGTHTAEYEVGCTYRDCCEVDCCSPDTQYEESTATCIPITEDSNKAAKKPAYDSIPIYLPENPECVENSDCEETGYCFSGPGGGVCTCHPKTNAGCDVDYVCATSSELTAAQGIAFFTENPPTCFLSFGASCSPQEVACLSGVCDKRTEQCACNAYTNYPCDTDAGEVCETDENYIYVCRISEKQEATEEPASAPVVIAPGLGSSSEMPTVIAGLGNIGANCLRNDECLSGSCSFGMIRGRSGSCVCNPETNAGCADNQVCASSEDLIYAQGMADAPPGCFLPVGEECDPSGEGGTCLTGNCLKTTLTCGCNAFQNFGCELGESCVVDEMTNEYVCQSDGGGGIPIGGKPTPVCPTVGEDVICTMEYAPVDCSGCTYSNQCQATGANSEFTSEICIPSKDCPTVGEDVICTMEYAPVDCSGCTYSNQCQATGANSEFTSCTPVAF